MATILHAFFMIFLTVNGITLGAARGYTAPPDLINLRPPRIRCNCPPQDPIYVPCLSTESPAGSSRKVFNPADNFRKPSQPTYIPEPDVCVCPRPVINLSCSGTDNITPHPTYKTTPLIISTLRRRVKCPDGQMFDSNGVCRTPLK